MSEPTGNTPSSRESTPNDLLHTPDHSMASTSPEQDERIPEIVKLSKSKGASALDKYYTENDEGIFFRNLKEAHAATDSAQWHAPIDDNTIPMSEEQDRQVIRRLVEAFLDTSSAMDTEGNAYRKRFTPGTNVFYSTWTIEGCAWEILGMVKAIHKDGFKAAIFDVEMLKAIGQTELWTFDERIGMICRVLKVSKSVAVSLMKHEKVWTIIGAPHKLYNSTIVNNQSNAFRNKWVKAGREAEKGRSNSETSQTPTTRRRRMTKTASRKTSTTLVPSPLSKAVPPSPSSSASVPSPSLIKQESVKHVASSPTQTDAREQDVEMVDAASDDPIKEQMSQGPSDARDGANQNSRTNVQAHSAHLPANTIVDTVAAPLARANRAPADVDAAELLLGLRKV